MDERLYDSRPNVIDRWRKCPAPKEPNRPVPMVSEFFTPPSEDPYYVNKWKKFREENATGEWFKREGINRGANKVGNVEIAPDRGDVFCATDSSAREL